MNKIPSLNIIILKLCFENILIGWTSCMQEANGHSEHVWALQC